MTTSRSPSGTVAGTTVLNWYKPGPESPANETSAATPPMVIRTSLVSFAAPEKSCPEATVGFVGPQPVPNNQIGSPGRAGRVVNVVPKSPAGPRYVASSATAAT